MTDIGWNLDFDERMKRLQAEEDEERKMKKERKKRAKHKEHTEEEAEADAPGLIDGGDDLAAMGLPMGFGSSKK